MSVIGGPNNPISNGLVYALDFKNNRCYVSGSNSAKSLLFNPTTASISAGFDNTTNTLIFSSSQNGTTNLTFPQVNYDKSFTISYVANIKNGGLGFGGNYSGSTTTLHTYFDTSSIRLGFLGTVTGFTGSYFTRTYPTSGNNQYTWVYTASGSFTLFVNGVPVSSSAANEGTTAYSGSDFKLSGRTSDTFWSGSLGNVYIYNRALTNDEIRANYTLASREYGLPTPPSFSIDENAYLFSQTAGITSSAYISALDTFVRGLKSASLWDKMVGIYPFLGGNNTLNQLNLKESSLTVYPASFTGSWSSSFSGSRSNTTASFATLTGLTPSTYYPSINTQSFHMAYLSYDTPTTGGFLMGAGTGVGATGGTITYANNKVIHTFTSGSGSFIPTHPSLTSVEVLVVAGGGGGGRGAGNNFGGGGGGAGGLIYSSSFSVTPSTTYTTVVGQGGASGSGDSTSGSNGQNSQFGSIISTGGGGGGAAGVAGPASNGNIGGSGGGAGNGPNPMGLGGSGSAGQGFAGGDITLNAVGGRGAGGGGAGGTGSIGDYNAEPGGLGGPGLVYSISGLPVSYSEGGQGGFYSTNNTGATGLANRGYGGGGTRFGTAGAGGSGIVIVSYPIIETAGTSSTTIYLTPFELSGSINNDVRGGFITGGPMGMIMVSRTGSNNYTISKNKVPTTITARASSSISSAILLNAININGSAYSSSQNNVAYASVGAGLTNDESRTYYDLVDTFQTSLGRGVSNPNAFITLWDTRLTGSGTSDSSSIALPLYGTQAITASWGDGTTSIISSSAQVDRTHVYATPGRYLITITGSGQSFQFYNSGDKTKILDVVQWGKFPPPPFFSFFGVPNVVGTATDAPSGSATDLRYLFNYSGFRGFINNWDVSAATNMSRAFESSPFNSPLDRWDVGNITDFGAAFISSQFNQPIGTWNVSRGTSFAQMFQGAVFNNGGSSNINNWRFSTSSAINFSSMFSSCALNQNIGAWNVEKVTNMGTMFLISAFNNSGSTSINNWRPISCSDFTNMFRSTPFNQPIENWPLSASNINMSSMFQSATAFNQNIGSWDVSKVTTMQNMFNTATAFNNSGSNAINNWRPISCSNFTYTFFNTPAFNQPIGNWPLSASNINMQQMFDNATSFNQNIGAWDVSKVTNMSSMFNYATAFNNSGSSDINNWRPVSCSNFSGMFLAAYAFNQPIGNWPISASGVNMSSMFYNASTFNQNIGSWDVSRATNMASMFRGTVFNNSGSTSINNWRPISCSNFSSMFTDADAFNQPIGNWPLSASNINMSFMFWQANSFNQNLGSWDVSKVTAMTYLFSAATAFNNSGSSDINNWRPISCSNFNQTFAFTNFNQPIGNWPLSASSIDMQYMFYQNPSFNQNITTWNTSKVTTMSNMFGSATAFNQNLGSWLIPSCSNMASMLDGCGMSKANYSATLTGWASQAPNIQSNVTLGASGRQYDTPGSASRAILTSAPYNWNITGDTFVP